MAESDELANETAGAGRANVLAAFPATAVDAVRSATQSVESDGAWRPQLGAAAAPSGWLGAAELVT